MTYIVSIPTLVTIITSIFTKTNANKCHISVSGIFLQGHVLSSYRAENIHACYETCQEKTGCLSINFYRESFICELNNRSIAQKPSKKGLDEMAVYFAKVNPVAIGSHDDLPAESCLEIKTITQSPSSGLYWLKNAHQSIKTYCNMTTGVGDNCVTSPCKNQGKCHRLDEVNYNCTCVGDFTGKNCEVKAECSSSPCLNGGTCTNTASGFTCACAAGYVGLRCEVINDAPCTTYTNITDSKRNMNYVTASPICDSGIVTKWYRLTGGAGQRMPSSCVPTKRCNTDASGWLSDPHPSTSQGILTRKVCFHWSNNCCNWAVNIRVRNCGAFYVYEFTKPPNCQLRFCGTN